MVEPGFEPGTNKLQGLWPYLLWYFVPLGWAQLRLKLVPCCRFPPPPDFYNKRKFCNVLCVYQKPPRGWGSCLMCSVCLSPYAGTRAPLSFPDSSQERHISRGRRDIAFSESFTKLASAFRFHCKATRKGTATSHSPLFFKKCIQAGHCSIY